MTFLLLLCNTSTPRVRKDKRALRTRCRKASRFKAGNWFPSFNHRNIAFRKRQLVFWSQGDAKCHIPKRCGFRPEFMPLKLFFWKCSIRTWAYCGNPSCLLWKTTWWFATTFWGIRAHKPSLHYNSVLRFCNTSTPIANASLCPFTSPPFYSHMKTRPGFLYDLSLVNCSCCNFLVVHKTSTAQGIPFLLHFAIDSMHHRHLSNQKFPPHIESLSSLTAHSPQ